MKLLALIPARGDSKRIPKKNIKPFLGKPIISYAIATAHSANIFDEIMISTDDREISETAAHFGAKIPFYRSDKNANDFASTADVITEVIESYKKKDKFFDYICCIYPTAPFVSTTLLKKAFEKLRTENLDVVYPVIKYSYPIQRAVTINNGKVSMMVPEHIHTRSQDLEETYHDAGQFYWLNTDQFLKKQEILTDNTGAIVIDELKAHDIDTLEDWKVAELKYSLFK